MRKIGSINHELYNPNKLDLILKRIVNASEQDQKQDYEILIDGFKAIPRNSDPDKFESFSEFITAESECMAVYLYLGKSKHSDCFFFYFKQVPLNKLKSNALSGNPEDLEKQLKDKFTKELYYENLERENEELKAEIEELENILESKEEHWSKIEKGQLHSYGEIGSALLTGIINNPHIKKLFPGLGGFEGQPEQETNQEETTSFKRKGDKEDQTENPKQSDFNEEEQAFIAMIQDMRKRLDETQLMHLGKIFELLVDNPIALKSTHKHILNFLNCKPKE